MKKVLALVFGLSLVAGVMLVFVRPPHADIIPAAAAKDVVPPRTMQADGRVVTRPGKEVRLSAELQGRVRTVNVVEGQLVKQGDVLAELDDAEIRGALQEAWGSSAEAYARLRARRADAKRTKALVAQGALPPTDDDHVREEQKAAEGRLQASAGASSRARALLAKTRIVAPIDGTIITRSIEPSETVAPGTPLFVIADLTARRVEAEVDEYDVGHVKVGVVAEVRADGFPGVQWQGQVEETALAVGPRKLRPQDPARPVDSSVLPVKISLPQDTPLKLGQRVVVTFRDEPSPLSASR